ncbi:hypothetical protein [Psychroserpens sp. S379A]|uniref:hypothetical protein n=1 Tax=Psychroserpens sp. S379A TaxID=3415137 RepID=UPI003C7C5C9F
MKKLSFLFCLFVLLTAFTCENESIDEDLLNQEYQDDNNEVNPSLLGDWEMIEFSAEISTESNIQGIMIGYDFVTEATDSNYVLTFEESDYSVSGSYDLATSTTFDGETTTTTDSYTNVSGSGAYSTNGNTMTFDGSFIEFDFDGLPQDVASGEQTTEFSLSDDGQTLTFAQDQVQEENQPGVVVTIHTISTSVWQKMD